MVLDEGAVVRVGINGKETEALAKKQEELKEKIQITGSEAIRSIVTNGADDRIYAVVANLGENAEKVCVTGAFVNVADGSAFDGNIAAGEVAVLQEA